MRNLSVMAFVVAILVPAQALGIYATTEDGRVVELKDDGTWIYVEVKQTEERSGFRNASWGDSPSSVRDKEDAEYKPDMSSDGIEVYSASVIGIDTLIGYFFVNNKLCRGRYMFIDEHTNRNDYITDYNNVKQQLIKKYGEPEQDESLWKDDLYQDDYSEWGFAVSLGHLVYYSTWANETVDISLILSGENYDITLVAEYASKALAGEEARQQEEANSSQF